MPSPADGVRWCAHRVIGALRVMSPVRRRELRRDRSIGRKRRSLAPTLELMASYSAPVLIGSNVVPGTRSSRFAGRG
jgi:hypothetical protein